jgi:hypothetical protein
LQTDGVATDLKVVGITNVMIDGDVDQFISNNPDVKVAVINAHNKAIESGINTRQAIFDLFSGVIKKSISTL